MNESTDDDAPYLSATEQFAADLKQAHDEALTAAAAALLCDTPQASGLDADTEEINTDGLAGTKDLRDPDVAPRVWRESYQRWVENVHMPEGFIIIENSALVWTSLRGIEIVHDEAVGPHASLTVALSDGGALDIPFDTLTEALMVCRFAMWRWGECRRQAAAMDMT